MQLQPSPDVSVAASEPVSTPSTDSLPNDGKKYSAQKWKQMLLFTCTGTAAQMHEPDRNVNNCPDKGGWDKPLPPIREDAGLMKVRSRLCKCCM